MGKVIAIRTIKKYQAEDRLIADKENIDAKVNNTKYYLCMNVVTNSC